MNELETLFLGARDLPGSLRAAFLDRECGADPGRRAQVEELLRQADRAADFFGDATSQSPGVMAAREPGNVAEVGEREGSVIGRYKLLQRIGEGGMGIVYMAEQEQPVRRRVALKIIKLGMDTRQVVARFEAERQALAMMDHPNIAKVLDAGATESGRPYFVMELVQGVPITDYCDQNKLSLRERLDLFLPVCKAIQSAHQKGVIHRDIKPSNVLVTLHYGDPMPKVIDFGVAKATSIKLTEKTVFTQFGTMIGTPAYMSPEQAEMSSMDVDTRTDIYSLGVLLYELLTGSTPFPQERLRSLAFGQLQKVIAEEEPQKPSTRLSTLEGKEKTSVAQKRGLRVDLIGGALRGDLDWIVMKCLEKDRRRRYDTVNGLFMDIGRHLANEPVLACPPSTAYAFRKAFRRNRTAFTAAGLIGSALLIGVVLSTWGTIRARKAESIARAEATRATAAERLAQERMREVTSERDAKVNALREAEAISRFLTGVFQSPDPTRDGRTITVAELLDRAAKKVEVDLARQPDRRNHLQSVLGSTYAALGMDREAALILEPVRTRVATKLGPDARDTMILNVQLANSYSATGRREEAMKLRLEVLRVSRQLSGPESLDAIGALSNLGNSYQEVGQHAEALETRERVWELSRKNLGEDHTMTLYAGLNLANSWVDAGRHGEALKLREENLSRSRRINGPEHRDTLDHMIGLAASYGHADRSTEQARLLREAYTLAQKLFGPDNRKTLSVLVNLIASIQASGTPESVVLGKEALRMARRVHGNVHPDTLRVMDWLATSYAAAGHVPEARQLRQESRRLLAQAYAANPTDSYFGLRCAALLAWFGMDAEYGTVRAEILKRAEKDTDPGALDRAAKAASLLPESDPKSLASALALGRRATELGAGHPYLAYFQFAQGLTEYRSGNLREALALFERAAPNPETAGALSGASSFFRCLALHRLGQAGPAESIFTAASKAMRPLPPDPDEPLAGGGDADDIIVWLAYREAREALGTPSVPAGR